MIEDPELIKLVELMSEVLAMQSMCKALKKEGYDFPELDRYLVSFNEISQALVVRMNKRLKEIGDYD